VKESARRSLEWGRGRIMRKERRGKAGVADRGTRGKKSISIRRRLARRRSTRGARKGWGELGKVKWRVTLGHREERKIAQNVPRSALGRAHKTRSITL